MKFFKSRCERGKHTFQPHPDHDVYRCRRCGRIELRKS